MGNVGEPIPSVRQGISQVAHILYQALIQEPEFNAPVLEKLQIPPENLSENNLKLFTAADLADLGNYLPITTNILPRRAQPDEFGDLLDISDELDREIPWVQRLFMTWNSNSTQFNSSSLAFWSNDPNPADYIKACVCFSWCIFRKRPRQQGVCMKNLKAWIR